MSFSKNGHAGEQGASNTNSPSSSRGATTRSSTRRRSGTGTYSGVTKSPRSPRNPPALQSITSTPAVHQPDLWEAIVTTTEGRAAERVDDHDNKRRRPGSVRWENLNMFGWVDGAWKPAAYHVAFREKLILRDAQQPGAKVWRKGMSLNYTSHSPLMLGWSKNPDSIQDSKGRDVCRMQRAPEDWTNNPRQGWLEFEGLVLLDLSNRPIRNFIGAPATIADTAPAWHVEGLRRTLGMTYWDIRARMPPVRNTPHGREPLQVYSHFSNAVGAWIRKVNKAAGKKIMFPWHTRGRNSDPTNDVSDNDPSQQVEEDEEAEEELDPVVTSSNGFQEEDAWHPNQALTEDETYRSSRPVGPSFEPYYLGQPNIQHVEQTYGANQLHAPTFPGTNMPAHMTNTALPENIYSPAYPSTFARQNIYNTGPYTSTSTFPSQNLYTTGAYPPNYSSQYIYTAPPNAYSLANPDLYSSPDYNNMSIPTAPGFGNLPINSDSLAMASQNPYTQPPPTNQVRYNHFDPQPRSAPRVRAQNPPTAAPQSSRPVATTIPAPAPPEENADMTFSTPDADPFMGAEFSDDWL